MIATTISRSGYSLIELLTGVAIISMIAYMGGDAFITYQQQMSSLNTTAKLVEVVEGLVATIQSEGSWDRTVSTNSGAGQPFECLLSPSGDCTAAATAGAQDFTPIQADGTYFRDYNPLSSATAGLNQDGLTCSTFNPAQPDMQCPFRFTFQRRFLCPTPPSSCIRPAVEIRIIFDSSVVLELGKPPFSLKVIRIPFAKLEPTLIKGGRIPVVTPRICGAGQVVTGVRSDGMVICTDWSSL